MKTVSKKLFSLLLVAVLLVSAVPFQAFADHDASHAWHYQHGNKNHWVVCENSGCGFEGAKEAHTWGTDNKCTVCGRDNATTGQSTTPGVGPAPVGPSAPECAHTVTTAMHDATTHWDECNDCHKKLNLSTHDWVVTVTTQPSCLDAGAGTRTCSKCTATESVTIPATGHTDKNGDLFCDTCKTYISETNSIKPTGTLKLDANGGNVSYTEMKVAKDQLIKTFGPLPTATKDGYEFKGWFLDDVTPIGDGSLCTWEGTRTAVAHYELITKNLTIKLVFADGSVATQTIFDRYLAAGANVLAFLYHDTELQNIISSYEKSYPGYDYEYFYDFAGKQPLLAQDLKLNESQTVFIRFTAKEFTIGFEPGAGATVTPTTQKVKYNQKVGTLPVPTRTDKANKIFAGWVDNTDGGLVYTSSTVYRLARNTTLTAVWNDKAVVILHVYMNGSFTSSDDYVLDGYATVDSITGLYQNVTREAVAKFITARYKPISGYNLQIDGLFTADTWVDYQKNTSKAGTPLVQINDVDIKNQHPVDIYVMLRNSTRGASTVVNKTPSDPTNPKTGDNAYLFTAATVMTLAAAGFVTLMVSRKRRAF